MITHVKLITPATGEPVTLDEAKLHLRERTTDNDSIIASHISAARDLFELWTSRQLLEATWELWLDKFENEIEIPKPPFLAIDSIKYIDENGVEQTLAASIYEVDSSVEPALLRLAYDQSWPTIRGQNNAIKVRYRAGYGSTNDVPEGIKAALKLLIGQLYEIREPVVTGTIATVIPFSLQSLIDSYKVMRLR